MIGHRSEIRARRAWWVLLGLVFAVGAAVGGCSDSGSGASPTTKPAAAAEITRLDVPASVPCGGKTSTTVTVTYATSNAKSVQLYVDGGQIKGVSDPSGTTTTPLHCDGVPHDVVLKALGAGQPVTQRKLVTTDLAS